MDNQTALPRRMIIFVQRVDPLRPDTMPRPPEVKLRNVTFALFKYVVHVIAGAQAVGEGRTVEGRPSAQTSQLSLR